MHIYKSAYQKFVYFPKSAIKNGKCSDKMIKQTLYRFSPDSFKRKQES